MKITRRTSMIIGLTLAAAVAVAMYYTLLRPAASPGRQIAHDKGVALVRVATLALAGAPGSVQFDPQGKLLVAVTGYSRVTAWSTSDWRELSGSAAASSIPPADAALGPDGIMAESHSNGTLGLTEMATGTLDGSLTVNRSAGVGDQLGVPMFSPDGKSIAVSDDLGRIYLVSVPGRRLAAVLTAETVYNPEFSLNGLSSPDIDSMAFSPDSKTIACGSESGIIHVWDVATRKNVSSFNTSGSDSGEVAASPVKTVAFSPDGKRLVTADNADGTLAVWSVTSGRRVDTINAGVGNVASAVFTADGTLIVATTTGGASDHRIDIWITRPGHGG